MKNFFPQTKDIPINNSLLTAESYFHDHRANGLVERHFADRTMILMIISGMPGMAFTIEDGESKPILLTEFSSASGEEGVIRAIELPDVAGRLVWLALESRIKNNYSLNGCGPWKDLLAQWKQSQWTGLAEITARKFHGFAFLGQGGIQESEIAFSTLHGFSTDTSLFELLDDSVYQITTYSQNTATQAYQCAILRHGVRDWSHQILSRYRDIVGEKLLQMMDRELNRQIQPWQWNITLNDRDLADTHFFPTLSEAANAYRALFMEMGMQMDFVIGSNLTKRILNETFELIYPDERAILFSQRLIPAAFS